MTSIDLFAELPHTASTAISREFCEQHDGVAILRQHARYHEFLKIATADQKRYRAFSCIRNPLDIIVTQYFKLKTNHQGFYTNPERWKNGGHVFNRQLRMFRFIQEAGASFPTVFGKLYRLPYDSGSALAHRQPDLIIRSENLKSDFGRVIGLLGMEVKRPLPTVNVMAEKDQDFLLHYTPEIRSRAVWAFGPYMKKCGYKFSRKWNASIPWSNQLLFRLLGGYREIKWRLQSYIWSLRKLLQSDKRSA